MKDFYLKCYFNCYELLLLLLIFIVTWMTVFGIPLIMYIVLFFCFTKRKVMWKVVLMRLFFIIWFKYFSLLFVCVVFKCTSSYVYIEIAHWLYEALNNNNGNPPMFEVVHYIHWAKLNYVLLNCVKQNEQLIKYIEYM